jgi:hypothetical protein
MPQQPLEMTRMLADTESDPSPDTPKSGLGDWTPEQQMAHMLDLCEAQMESALQESDKAVNTLIQAFTALVDTTRSMGVLAEQLPENLKQAGEHGLDQQVDSMTKQMGAAIVAFQFYDKLTQRLGHVRYSLSTLAMFVCDRKQAEQREQWQRLFNTLRRLYRTEEEREIFQLMAEGMSADDARSTLEKSQKAPAESGDIELF